MIGRGIGGEGVIWRFRNRRHRPLLALRTEDGTITANPREMRDLINRCWVEGVFNKKDASAQHQEWMDCAEEGQENGLDYQDMVQGGPLVSFRSPTLVRLG